MKTCVIAKTHIDFKKYIMNNNLSSKDFIYISNVDKLRGLRNCKIVYIGKYFERDDIKEITEYIRMMKWAGDIKREEE